ncbi:TetR/AcrR family transcriptional regulator [Geodermatophilus sp. CPCC 206100]|uniref:TetR/AcrR family transcriptional regulator n=1 Tax=Geodermatophilus sp. CPCC 206100 TaxID=3020054 RepID=UPI003B0018AD
MLTATRDLIDEVGFSRFSIDALAIRAGVSKATVYRWWDNRADVAMDALLDAAGPDTPVLHAGSALENLVSHVHIGVAFLAGPHGRTLAGVVGDAQHDPQLAQAFRDRYLSRRRRLVIGLIRQAIDDGDLRPDTDPDLLVDVLIGPMYYRLLLGHAAVTEAMADALVDVVLRSHGTARARPRPRAPDPARAS